jgi:uncharacterized membrane protein YccC
VLSVAGVRARLGAAARDPVRWTDLIQLVKTVVAAVLAWVVAAQVLGLPQTFLAPWSALLVVHATVYRTFSQGVRQVTSAVLGVLVAWLVGNVLGLTTLSVAVLLVAGLLIGAMRWFEGESTTVAATGLIVLTTGSSTQDHVLVDRLLDTLVGIVVGLAVNLVVWPPLRDHAAARAVDGIDDEVGALLRDMAEGLRGACDQDPVSGWVDRTRDLDEAIDHAWSLVRQARESSRLNPRRAAVGVRRNDSFGEILRDNEQAVAETRSMARTLAHSIDDLVEWHPEFRERWLTLLHEAGEAIGEPDSARVTEVRAALHRLAEDMTDQDVAARHWPEYGALIMNLRNVVTSMDRVAEENPVVLTRYARRERLLRR